MKICRDCKKEKPIVEFVKNHICQNGIDTLCLMCNRRRVKEYRAAGKRNSAKEARIYYSRHPEKCLARYSKYRAKKLSAFPNWLDEDELWLIEEIYELAQHRTRITRVKWDVDHIIPLQGNTVSGLHIPQNLQVIPAKYNQIKGNRY